MYFRFPLLPTLSILLVVGSCRRESDIGPAPEAAAAVESGETQDSKGSTPVEPPRGMEKISFNEHVQPILSASCYACHGFDPGSRFPEEDPLRIDREDFAFQPRDNGKPVIIKGDPAASALIRRVKSTDPEQVMPPPDHHHALDAAEIAILEQWIAEGAEYEEHWSFVAPIRPPLPESGSDSWVRTPVDAFILDELRRNGLEPAPPADPRRLIRRVTLDLTGLLPEPAEVEAFAADPSEENYLAHVDRLLASPRFGEQRGRYWLDYARYADTHGKHFDNIRNIWPWRDYVIRSFNDNKPFDRFVREQIAGDLLPDADLESLVGTGYLRCAVTTNEGGTIPEEILVDKTRDRAEAFGTTFLGLTVGCAACHDHKFDPITQKDFYSLTAFFNNTTDKPWDENIAESPPTLRIPGDEMRAEADEVAGRLGKLRGELAGRLEQAPSLLAAHPPAPVSGDGLSVHLKLDENQGDVIRNHAPGSAESFTAETNPLIWGETSWLWPGMRMDINSKLVLGDHGDFDFDQAFTFASWLNLRLKTSNANTGNGSIVSRMGDASRHSHRGWDLFMEDDKFIVHIVHRWPEHAIRVESPPFSRGTWRHVAFRYDGSSTAAGIGMWVDGKEVELKASHDSLLPGQTIRTDAPMHLGRREDTQPMRETAFQDLRLYQRALAPDEISRLPIEAPAAEMIAAKPDPGTWSHDERFLVHGHWLHGKADPRAGELRREIELQNSRLAELSKDGPATMIAYERATPAEAHVLDRGVYSARKERVFPATPHFLPPLPAGAVADRAGLADWLLTADNPLFSRVTVNRIWQELFGAGLVGSAGDFGIMGDRPSHPELLDWLAVEFRESGWDVKRFYRELVRSATYRESDASPAATRGIDPANRLLSRGARHRLDAEILRDTSLQASGLLIEKVGGPPVKPYQPEGIWRAVSMPESNTFIYEQEHGEALYRRSIYSFWKRFAPPPSLETFDAPAREVVCPTRPRTNTPLQALVMMNDPQIVEAARKLAERLIRGAESDDERLTDLSEILLSRPTTADEAERLRPVLAEYRAHFDASPESAKDLLTTGEAPADPELDPVETAAWTLMASQYLNLDEFLNR